MLTFFTYFVAILLAGISGWFSVAGLMVIFAGNQVAGISAGIAVELGKLIGVSWLYRNWDDKVWFRTPLMAVVLTAMVITSCGVFGYLSKAHIDQGAPATNNLAKIELLDQQISIENDKIKRESDNIDSLNGIVKQMDDQIAVLIEYKKISDPKLGATAIREKQRDERRQLSHDIRESQEIIKTSQEKISTLQIDKLQLSQVIRDHEVEVGPIMYMAAMFYDTPQDNIDDAVRIFIILIMLSLDPMAIMLLMCANHSSMLSAKQTQDVHGTVEEQTPSILLGDEDFIDDIEEMVSDASDVVGSISPVDTIMDAASNIVDNIESAYDFLEDSLDKIVKEDEQVATTPEKPLPDDKVEKNVKLTQSERKRVNIYNPYSKKTISKKC